MLIAHDNGEEIRLANGTATSAKINKEVKPAEAFGLENNEDEVEVTDNVEVEEEVVEDFTL